MKAVERVGQVRVFWDDNPVDLFSTHAFHDQAEAEIVQVPFADTTIPVLGATELAVFKAFFNRTKDWADIEAMVDAETVDVHRAMGWLVDLLGPDDERLPGCDDCSTDGRRPKSLGSLREHAIRDGPTRRAR